MAAQESSVRRGVTLRRISPEIYEATNSKGVTVRVGHGDEVFGPVELLLAATAACTSIDVDVATSRHAEPEKFEVTSAGDVVKGEQGNKVENMELNFSLRFPDTDEGRRAQSMVERLVKISREKDCTVGRTVALPTELHSAVDGKIVA
jgi:putative redox protein